MPTPTVTRSATRPTSRRRPAVVARRARHSLIARARLVGTTPDAASCPTSLEPTAGATLVNDAVQTGSLTSASGTHSMRDRRAARADVPGETSRTPPSHGLLATPTAIDLVPETRTHAPSDPHRSRGRRGIAARSRNAGGSKAMRDRCGCRTVSGRVRVREISSERRTYTPQMGCEASRGQGDRVLGTARHGVLVNDAGSPRERCGLDDRVWQRPCDGGPDPHDHQVADPGRRLWSGEP